MGKETDRRQWPRPLNATKLDPPLAPVGCIGQPGLVQSLIASSAPLILVDAPVGWGKSSAIASWSNAEHEPRPFAFLRLEAEDNAPCCLQIAIATRADPPLGLTRHRARGTTPTHAKPRYKEATAIVRGQCHPGLRGR